MAWLHAFSTVDLLPVCCTGCTPLPTLPVVAAALLGNNLVIILPVMASMAMVEHQKMEMDEHPSSKTAISLNLRFGGCYILGGRDYLAIIDG